ncbi:hypothetical protein VCSRO111_2152 [Vibrio cholerae]|nr:hypothetical protein VCSRO192_3492 [Vibrio cholerae]GHX95530.1 hypothetical protein VCSRO111_2152 [Vibrio cholerae]GIC06132.1 hypothetical protein VCSRO50_3345 [Vibrio cholerae]
MGSNHALHCRFLLLLLALTLLVLMILLPSGIVMSGKERLA